MVVLKEDAVFPQSGRHLNVNVNAGVRECEYEWHSPESKSECQIALKEI